MAEPHAGVRRRPSAVARGLYVRQLRCGRDIALLSETLEGSLNRKVFEVARQMQNFVYLVGNRNTGECVVVDGAWDVEGIARLAAAEGMKIVSNIVTHWHFDHAGGRTPLNVIGVAVPGALEWAAKGINTIVHEDDKDRLWGQTGMSYSNIISVSDRQRIELAGTYFTFLHTPGHTAGSVCVLACLEREWNGRNSVLIGGDTLFPGVCGRCDLPDSDHKKMHRSLQVTLRSLPEELEVFPGHAYTAEMTTVGYEKQHGLLQEISEEVWLSRFAPPLLARIIGFLVRMLWLLLSMFKMRLPGIGIG